MTAKVDGFFYENKYLGPGVENIPDTRGAIRRKIDTFTPGVSGFSRHLRLDHLQVKQVVGERGNVSYELANSFTEKDVESLCKKAIRLGKSLIKQVDAGLDETSNKGNSGHDAVIFADLSTPVAPVMAVNLATSLIQASQGLASAKDSAILIFQAARSQGMDQSVLLSLAEDHMQTAANKLSLATLNGSSELMDLADVLSTLIIGVSHLGVESTAAIAAGTGVASALTLAAICYVGANATYDVVQTVSTEKKVAKVAKLLRVTPNDLQRLNSIGKKLALLEEKFEGLQKQSDREQRLKELKEDLSLLEQAKVESDATGIESVNINPMYKDLKNLLEVELQEYEGYCDREEDDAFNRLKEEKYKLEDELHTLMSMSSGQTEDVQSSFTSMERQILVKRWVEFSKRRLPHKRYHAYLDLVGSSIGLLSTVTAIGLDAGGVSAPAGMTVGIGGAALSLVLRYGGHVTLGAYHSFQRQRMQGKVEKSLSKENRVALHALQKLTIEKRQLGQKVLRLHQSGNQPDRLNLLMERLFYVNESLEALNIAFKHNMWRMDLGDESAGMRDLILHAIKLEADENIPLPESFDRNRQFDPQTASVTEMVLPVLMRAEMKKTEKQRARTEQDNSKYIERGELTKTKLPPNPYVQARAKFLKDPVHCWNKLY